MFDTGTVADSASMAELSMRPSEATFQQEHCRNVSRSGERSPEAGARMSGILGLKWSLTSQFSSFLPCNLAPFVPCFAELLIDSGDLLAARYQFDSTTSQAFVVSGYSSTGIAINWQKEHTSSWEPGLRQGA